MRKFIARTLSVLGLLVLSSTFAFAQTSNGTIVGTVTDATGAAVPGATVTATSTDTGEKHTVKTNSVGGYRIESVTPGNFDVSAEASGFSKFVRRNVRVAGSIQTSVNETLSVGAADAVSIDVAGGIDTLDTDTGALSGTLSAATVSNLPLSGLNAYSYALTLPGVQSAGGEGFSNGVNFSVNGSRARANNFLIEGSDNNDAGIHGQGLQPENLDAIEQVVFLLNSNAAEFGGGGGSINNLIFKNGSNRFHGAAWDRMLNSSLDAADKYNVYDGSTKSKYRENIFGYDIGGFVLKDKLFFFNSLQWDHYRSSTQSVLKIPTASGIASLKTLSTNSRINTLLQALGGLQGTDDTNSIYFHCYQITETVAATAYCPTGNAIAVGSVIRNIPNDTNGLELDNKVEWLPTSKDNIQFRYIRSTFNAPYDVYNYPSQLPGFDTTQKGTAQNYGITAIHTFNPNLSNELRLSYGRIGFIFDLQAATYANPLGTSPTTSITGIEGFGAPSGDPQSRQHNTYQLQDAVTWNISSRHAVKFGFDILDTRVHDAIPFNLYGSISYNSTQAYSGLANYIDDFGGSNGTAAKNFGSPIARPQMWSQNYYIQDDWKFSKNLILNLGFRYQYDGVPFNGEKYPAWDPTNTACTNPGTSAGVTLFCHVDEKGDWSNWGPRFGFAYAPEWLGKKTVLRGGFGVFYDGLFTNIVDNTQSTSPNMAAPEVISTASGSSRGLANFSSYLTALTSGLPARSDLIESMVPNIRSPRTMQWNLNVEQDLGHGFISQIGYVGTRGEHLYATTETNPYVDPYGQTSNPTGRLFQTLSGRVLLRDNTGDSMYHSAQVQIKRSFHHGFGMQASYTWSKLMDDVSEIFTSGNASTYGMLQYPNARKAIDWGQSAIDTRHRLALAYVYAPPTWHAQGAMKIASSIVNGFQFSAIDVFASGNPANVEVGYDYNADGIGNDRPALANPRAPQGSYAWDRSWWYDGNPGYCEGADLWNNGVCTPVTLQQVHYYVPATGGPLYTTIEAPVVQRNSFRTLGFQEHDLTIQRTFHIHEGHSIDFRAEAFNWLNQGYTGTPNTTLTSGVNPADGSLGPSTFGNFTDTTGGHRNLRFFARYSF